MLFEMTLFANFVLHHLFIGAGLLLALRAIQRWASPGTELMSWLWVTAFFISTLMPFLVFSPEPQASVLVGAGKMIMAPEIRRAEPMVIRDTLVPVTQWHVPSGMVYQVSWGLYGFFILWMLGCGWRVVSLYRAFQRTLRLKEQASPMSNCQECADVAADVLRSGTAASPMATGLLAPVIIMPSALLSQGKPSEIKSVLLHEQAHIQRRDLWVSLAQEWVAVVFWWSPVMRALNHQIHLSRELACDLRAASQLESQQDYAQSLLNCARLMLTQKRNVLAMGLFGKKKELTMRIQHMLNNKSAKTPALAQVLLACGAFAFSGIALSAVLTPKVNMAQIKTESNHFSELSPAKSELLIEAVSMGDQSLIQNMVQQGLDINTPLLGDGTALMLAVKSDQPQLVKSLLEMGADVNQSSHGDGNPLIVAAMNGRLELAEYLLAQGADVNAIVPGDETPLINCISSDLI